MRDGEGDDPKVVAFGGGTGMPSLLRGLKRYTGRITAVVTVTDDGGSSGLLRKDFDIIPPGDIRNCLVALAEGEPLLSQLFQYRFTEAAFRGHNFGNLFITALTRITGSFEEAIREMNRILSVRGRVLPSTNRKVSIVAHHPDGTKSTGEGEITRSGKVIERMELRPEPEPAGPEILEALDAADLIVFGPGSLYTSIVPNLLVPGILEAVRRSRVPRAYVCNIMTQPGETTSFSAADHVETLERHGTPGLLDAIIVNVGEIPGRIRRQYARQGARPVVVDRERLEGRRVIEGDFVAAGALARHDPERLGRLLAETFFGVPGEGREGRDHEPVRAARPPDDDVRDDRPEIPL
ncbi:MAG: YvcK family protein [Planctomycetes bacterium]|nr:YvcK family protein [Planctomycetota bacterium]